MNLAMSPTTATAMALPWIWPMALLALVISCPWNWLKPGETGKGWNLEIMSDKLLICIYSKYRIMIYDIYIYISPKGIECRIDDYVNSQSIDWMGRNLSFSLLISIK